MIDLFGLSLASVHQRKSSLEYDKETHLIPSESDFKQQPKTDGLGQESAIFFNYDSMILR